MSTNHEVKGQKYKSKYCDDTMTFQDCELAILRHAVDESELIKGQKISNSEEIKNIINILEDFLIQKKLVCYGGTAINNILPNYAQFYNREVEVPDYDFFSPNALDDAKELSDIYYKRGYTEVEAKSGVHFGTFKVFVNFIPVADITYLTPLLFDSIKKESIPVAGILYAPPNFLRMSMYLELSRPAGDVSRWEKVLKRLTLLNKYYPLKTVKNCNKIDFQRKLGENPMKSKQIYFTLRDTLIEQGVVFFGGYASSLYSRYMPKYRQRLIKNNPDFDVLSEDINRSATIVTERLAENNIKNIKKIYHEPIGETIPECIEIMIGKDTVAYIYSPIACHNYNTIQLGDKEINVATIDTMLSLYLAFIYADEYRFTKDRIMCMAQFLFDVEEQNRLEQKGLLKRFNMKCIGKQPGLDEIRNEKTMKFKELSDKRDTREYEMWFLKYNPASRHESRHVETDTKEPENKKGKYTKHRKPRRNTTRKVQNRINLGYLY